MRMLGVLTFLSIVTLPGQALADNTFTVTVGSANGSFVWMVNGSPNPGLTLTRGQTYTFSVTSPGHPFDIKTAPVTGTGSQFTEGVTGEETTSGTLTFVVPADAPATLYYQCEVHSSMVGQLTIVMASSAPALRWPTVLMLGLGLGAAAFGVARARARRGEQA